MCPVIERRSDYRRDLPHKQNGSATLFVTMTTCKRWVLPPEARSIVLDHIRREHNHRVFLYAAVVMPDHVHALFAPLPDDTGECFGLAEIMNGMRGPSAHAVNNLLGRRGPVWDRDFFDRLLRHGEFERYMDYICLNPVRRGLARTEEEYPWLWVEAVY
jgi:REP element-mobilizing transposase RayT